MKKLLLIAFLGALGSSHYISADILNAVASFIGDPQPYSKTGYGVEVLNKTGSSIWVTVINAEGLKGADFNYNDPAEVKANGFFEEGSRAFKTKIDKKTALAIWAKKPQQIKISKNIISKGTWEVTPKPDWLVEFESGKTAYVTVDKNGVRPQTGPRGGAAGKTNSGLSLEKNVTTGGITSIK